MYVHQFVFEIRLAKNEGYQLYNSGSDHEKLIQKNGRFFFDKSSQFIE